MRKVKQWFGWFSGALLYVGALFDTYVNANQVVTKAVTLWATGAIVAACLVLELYARLIGVTWKKGASWARVRSFFPWLPAVGLGLALPFWIPRVLGPPSPEISSRRAGEIGLELNGPEDFSLRGDIVVEGDRGLPVNIAVRIFWLEFVGEDTYVQSPEIDYIDPSTGRMAYSLSVKRPAGNLIRWKDGMRIGTGVVAAFVDEGRDGTLTPGNDKLIAVNQERIVSYAEGEFLPDDQMRPEKRAYLEKKASALPRGFSVYRRSPETQDFDTRIQESDGKAQIDLFFNEKTDDYFDSLHKEIVRDLGG